MGGDAADLLERQVQAVRLQLALGMLERGQHGGLSGHQIDQSSSLAVVDAEDSQFRVQARTGLLSASGCQHDEGETDYLHSAPFCQSDVIGLRHAASDSQRCDAQSVRLVSI